MGDTVHRDILRQIIEPKRTRKPASRRVVRMRIRREWIDAVNAVTAFDAAPALERVVPASQEPPATE